MAKSAAAAARAEAAAAKAEANAARAEARRVLDAARAEADTILERAHRQAEADAEQARAAARRSGEREVAVLDRDRQGAGRRGRAPGSPDGRAGAAAHRGGGAAGRAGAAAHRRRAPSWPTGRPRWPRGRPSWPTAEEQRRRELERIAGLTADAARAELVEAIETQAKREAALLVRDIETDARSTAEQRARHIVVDAIQRVASEQTAESVVSVLHLPGDEMKGRIIGREGRNIRAFESVTGVNLIIDDTPEAVLLSCFDPVRREVGRLTLEKLVLDGRIHPHRIEEVFDAGPAARSSGCASGPPRTRWSRSASPTCTRSWSPCWAGCATAPRTGRTCSSTWSRPRTSPASWPPSCGWTCRLIKRCAFLHDIGKALTHEVEGSHALIGADLARKYGESEDVVHAIEAHHNEVPPQTIEAVLTQASRRLLRRPAGRAAGEPRGVREAAGADRGDRRPASSAWRRSSPCRPAGRSG